MHISLDRATKGQSLSVVSVGCGQALRSRLCELGLTAGSRVQYLYPSFFGDPKAYLVRGAVLCIRRSDAEKILCRERAENGGTVPQLDES